VIHTDNPKAIKQAIAPPEQLNQHMVLPLLKGHQSTHALLGNIHRAAIAYAERGECIAFINADMVPSIEIFEAAEKRFRQGKRLIMMAATRTLGGDPPIGSTSRELLRWTMDNQHPIITECFWGSGRAVDPWAIYFQHDDAIVLHGFHLHPFAVMNDRQLIFRRKTIDNDLPDNFRQPEIHVVIDADEAAFAEMSEPAPSLKLTPHPVNIETAVMWARRSATPMHRWFFEQRIAICGNGADIGDGKMCHKILRALKKE
jgi:hypothetical protein